MGGGFGDSPKHQPDAHPCAEQHGEPGMKRKVRFGPIRSKRNITPSGKYETESANKKTRCCQDIQPAKRIEKRRLECAGDFCQMFRGYGTPQQKEKGEGAGDVEDKGGGFQWIHGAIELNEEA